MNVSIILLSIATICASVSNIILGRRVESMNRRINFLEGRLERTQGAFFRLHDLYRNLKKEVEK